MTTIDNTKAENFTSLFTYLGAERGHQVLMATMGKNGNGGQLADADDLLADGIDGFDPVPFESEDLEQHWRDAGSIGDGKPAEFLAFDRHEMDKDGYLTGSITRIYVDLIS